MEFCNDHLLAIAKRLSRMALFLWKISIYLHKTDPNHHLFVLCDIVHHLNCLPSKKWINFCLSNKSFLWLSNCDWSFCMHYTHIKIEWWQKLVLVTACDLLSAVLWLREIMVVLFVRMVCASKFFWLLISRAYFSI